MTWPWPSWSVLLRRMVTRNPSAVSSMSGDAARVEFRVGDSPMTLSAIAREVDYVDFAFLDGAASAMKSFREFAVLEPKFRPGSILVMDNAALPRRRSRTGNGVTEETANGLGSAVLVSTCGALVSYSAIRLLLHPGNAAPPDFATRRVLMERYRPSSWPRLESIPVTRRR
jgi:hypothetical protein